MKMNMEEKKKLEKIALGDIEKTISSINQKRQDELSKLEESLKKNPTPEVKKMMENYKKAKEEIIKTEKEIDKLGFHFYDDREDGIRLSMNSYGSVHKEVEKKRKEFDDKIKKAENLRRDIVVGLYTTGVEAQAFLNNLAKKLEALLG